MSYRATGFPEEGLQWEAEREKERNGKKREKRREGRKGERKSGGEKGERREKGRRKERGRRKEKKILFLNCPQKVDKPSKSDH